MGVRARHDRGRWFLEHFSGSDFWRRAGRWITKLRRIDSDSDWYDEVISDPETGKVIHDQHHPLSQHQGHGLAKPPRKIE